MYCCDLELLLLLVYLSSETRNGCHGNKLIGPLSLPHRDQNGFRPKRLKAHNAELSSVCICLLNEPQMKHLVSGG